MTLSELSVSELPRLQAWKAKGSLKKLQDDVEIFCIASDDFFKRQRPSSGKPRLLIVHGFPTASFDFHKIYDMLTQQFEVFLWDMVGFGFSQKIYKTIYEQVDLVNALLRSCLARDDDDDDNVTTKLNVHILAHDLGDTVVQEMLARKENDQLCFSIQSVVMLNGGILPWCHRPTLMQRLLLVPCLNTVLAQLVSISLFQTSISKVFGPDTKPTDLEVQEYYALVRCNGGDKLTTENIKYMQERQVYCNRWVDSIRQYARKSPFLLIDGPADPVSGRHLAEAVRTEVEGARVVLLNDRIGHWPQVEAPEEMLEAFFDFHKDIKTFEE
jgi:pimeloyl-ACP methyl ester carboxylesterase